MFYEVGIAHTLGREVILIAQSEHDIPFDLRHLRHIRYLNNAEGRAVLTEALQARMADHPWTLAKIRLPQARSFG